MKKIFSAILISVILIMSAITAYGNALVVDPLYPDFEFTVESGANDTIVSAVHSYQGTNENIIIPDYAYENIVKYIDEKAFYKNQVISKVYLSENITQIRKWAFRNCPNLTYVYFPESLAVIWQNAFAYSPNIQSVMLSHTQVENFYDGAFLNVTSLKTVTLPPTTKSIGSSCFSGTSIESITIPDGVEIIGHSAFAENTNLKEVYIPSSVVNIGSGLFEGSENVTVYCEEGSVADQYCAENNIDSVNISENEFPSQLYGDVDNSHNVDINDVTAMQKKIARIETEFNVNNCDINKDCRFDIRDASHLQYMLANML